jgi:DNA-binding IclR family transcriptional regulator
VTSTRDRILAFVRDSKHSPSVAEIAKHVGRSKSTVHVHLVALERQGFIERHGAERRIYATRDAA